MYIGFSNNPERRFNDHKSNSFNLKSKDYNEAIHKAIRKYGLENFEFNIIENNIPTLEKAKEQEKYWIKYYNTYENRAHYNETPGGDSVGVNNIHLGEKHGLAKLTTEEVIYCRKCYTKGLRSRDIYNLKFKNKMTYSGFLRMWHGKNWSHIMPEVFNHNPHPGKYGEKDRDIIIALFKESGLTINQFLKTSECYVGYGTLWKMINTPEFYNGK